ncbi:YbhB/YbcL family Raf kinase inhibitor-like protein [Spirillospora sp. CA-294931]|uniref:YbhB/YbcL family Raf kinase inhibitor-like protein n=1 Tax=Spirillospora sp. CA-294931 TaxID=3240042 RepID=UPI003D8EEF42
MMSQHRRSTLAAASALALAGAALSGCGFIGAPQNKSAELAEWFTVTIPGFRDGRDLPTRLGCATYPGGEGKTPNLYWSGTPSGTKSYAIVVDDPDADNGAYVHWVIAGIGENVNQLVEGTKLDRTWVQGLNTGKQVGYKPPCPPKGERHRFRFTIYALNAGAPFANGAKLRDSLAAIAKHTIGRGRVTGNFGSKSSR